MRMCKNRSVRNTMLFFAALLSLLITLPSVDAQVSIDSNLVMNIEREVIRKEKRLVRMVRSGEIAHEIIADYELESFRIDEYLNRRLLRNNEISNYIQELLLAEKRYQVILAKYLLILQGLLSDEDQILLSNSQATWQAYRGHEQQLNRRLNPEGYDLPAIPIETIAERHLDITKYRVIELVDYIARMKEE